MDLKADLVVAAMDAVPMQAALLDARGTIRYTNRAWREFGSENGLTGAPDSVGTNYLHVCERAGPEDVPPGTLDDPPQDDTEDDPRAAAAGIRAVLAGESESFVHEYPCHSPDERRWFTMRATRFTVDGDPYAVVVHLDITERKLAELEVAAKNDRLESVASVLSHDLRNPLAVALASAEFLAAEADEDGDVERLRSSLERMETILDDALVFARQEGVEETTPLDFETVVEDAWSNVETAEMTLRVESSGVLDADEGLLKHLLENLVRNAREHAGSGTTVTVGVDDGEGEVGTGTIDGFFVADDGPGIPADEREAVLDMGYTTERDGNGLGLAIVAQVVEAHGWTLDVGESESGGARFDVRTSA